MDIIYLLQLHPSKNITVNKSREEQTAFLGFRNEKNKKIKKVTKTTQNHYAN